MIPQLQLTNLGQAVLVLNPLAYDFVLEKFVCGSSFNVNGETMQTENPFSFDIAFQQKYIKGQQYEKDGVLVTEDYNHIKIMGYLSSSDITFDETGEYTVKEIGLIGYYTSQENTKICVAYGYNEEGITLYQNNNGKYIIKLDIICDKAPSVNITNSTGYVAYNDFLNHKNDIISNNNPVHGITYDNGDLSINNNSLDICTKNILNKIAGTSIFNTLPVPSLEYLDILALDKTTNALYKCIKSTELEVGDYIYEDDGTWTVGDGTETGALEIIADSATPSSNEINLTEAQNHFMEWSNVNNINKRLSLVESVSLGGITDIIDNLQNQLNTLLNAQQSPFPAWSSSTSYTVGDICINSNFNSYKYLECVTAGTSGTTAPSNSNIGTLVPDNEVKWLVCDWRDSAPVGTIKQDLVKRDGWLKLNGATINVADYPRLVSFLSANSLIQSYTASPVATDFTYGDSNNKTLILPNFTNLFIESGSSALSNKSAGLPNISGNVYIDLPNVTAIRVTGSSGAFETDNSSNNIKKLQLVSGTETGNTRLKFNARNSNSIYGNSNTVQPPAVTLIPCIKY